MTFPRDCRLSAAPETDAAGIGVAYGTTTFPLDGLTFEELNFVAGSRAGQPADARQPRPATARGSV